MHLMRTNYEYQSTPEIILSQCMGRPQGRGSQFIGKQQTNPLSYSHADTQPYILGQITSFRRRAFAILQCIVSRVSREEILVNGPATYRAMKQT